jgi:phosphatidylglycerol:prolipoprotein diacylglycerol transferase
MLPVLLDLKFIKIYTFGVFLVLSFFWGMFLLWKNIKLTSQKEEEIFDGLFVALAGGLFFSRLFYVLLNFSDFGFNILKFILINGYPGLSLVGGFLGGFFSLWLFFRSKNIKWLEAVDYFIPPLFLAIFIGKIGSFFAGVDVGVRTNFFLKISYLGYQGERHLTAVYEAIFFALGSYLSYKILMRLRRGLYPSGFVFYFFAFYFSLTTLLLDKLKANHLYLAGGSFNYLISLVFSFVFSVYFIYFFGRRPEFQNKIREYGKKTYQNIIGKIKIKTTKRGKRIN